MAKQPTKTDRIRELYLAGKTISEVAKELGIRYQHAYNTLVRLGLYQPKSKKQRSARPEKPRVDPGAYAAFIRGVDLKAVFLEALEARLYERPGGRLGLEIHLSPTEKLPVPVEEGFSAGLRFEVRFLIREGEGKEEREFGRIRAVWRAVYRSSSLPSPEVFEVFAMRNLPVNLWPYFRVQVDQLTAEMGLPRLVLPAFKTVS